MLFFDFVLIIFKIEEIKYWIPQSYLVLSFDVLNSKPILVNFKFNLPGSDNYSTFPMIHYAQIENNATPMLIILITIM